MAWQTFLPRSGSVRGDCVCLMDQSAPGWRGVGRVVEPYGQRPANSRTALRPRTFLETPTKLERKETKTAAQGTKTALQESGKKLHSNILHSRKVAGNCNAGFSNFQRILRNCSAVFSETSDLWYSKLDMSSHITPQRPSGAHDVGGSCPVRAQKSIPPTTRSQSNA